MMGAFTQTQDSLDSVYRSFLDTLRPDFKGEINTDYANRIVLATDNSIYQRLPQAVIYPTCEQDIQQITSLMKDPDFHSVVLTARGGGTGTNGQSLTEGIVVDLSRHMNQIIEINVEQRWARVEAGVVKDQLNAALKPHGLFFAPELSTSNRATIGGMVNTDASGQGSCVYGKTRDHVLSLKHVLIGGDCLDTESISENELQQSCARDDRIGEIYRKVSAISTEQSELIKQTFPELNRCLTGYDLAHLQDKDKGFNLNSVLCGSEGTLGFLVEAKLNLLPIPNYSVLVNVSYLHFMDALRDAEALMKQQPLSIETVDSKVLMLAKQDSVWQSVAAYFPDHEQDVLGINLVEFSGTDKHSVEHQVEQFLAFIKADSSIERLGCTIARGNDAVKTVYGMRKRAVGLLGNIQGEARPQPFIEDMAVPPHNLADFIYELRQLLDSYELQYGMFGHVDAGVLHVRPLLDMKDLKQAGLIRPITDAAVKLIEQYGGLLWGEHGKGVRSEYAPNFFGALYPAIQQVKAAFDPYNQLNPGKIATPYSQPHSTLLKIDQVPIRGEFDRQIPTSLWQSYGAAMHCNGNGACFNYDLDDAMCPSWKATRQRIHSPKGRASLMREWVRIKPTNIKWWNRLLTSQNDAFSNQVYDAMSGCLGCKSCAGQCPVKVDIPELKSRFLSEYHQQHIRPLRDYMIGSIEFTMPYIAKLPKLYNFFLAKKSVKTIIASLFGMVDNPLLSEQSQLIKAKQYWNIQIASSELLETLTLEQRQRSVILVQDTFTRYFDTPLFADFIELMAQLGYSVWLAPLNPNGKPLHVQGFRKAFNKTATRNIRSLQQLAKFEIPMVGLDPAMTLVYRQEYTKVISDKTNMPTVLLPQEWLLKVLPESISPQQSKGYRLLPHCTEKTNAANSMQSWHALFERRGIALTIPAVGCCGMSGTYGHELRNLETSKIIFDQSWKKQLDERSEQTELLATGYSCRSQVKRFNQGELKHPIQVLLESISSEKMLKAG